MDDIDWGSVVDEELLHEGSEEYRETAWSQAPGSGAAPGGQVDTLAGGDGPSLPQPATEEQGAQTDESTADKEVNTEQNWESLMRAVEDCSSLLAKQYEELTTQHKDEEAQHRRHVDGLETRKDEARRHQQALLDKMESLRVKLQLNCGKTIRKNFAVKKQELSAEKSRMEEERSRLSQELEETERKLTLLIEEQSQEKQAWGLELADLDAEMQPLQREAEEAARNALRDETVALETQREAVMSQVDEWLKDSERYLNMLRMDPSQQPQHKRMEWERNEGLVRCSQASLQKQFSEHVQLLQQGHQLDSLPKLILPPLPQVPTMDLMMNQMNQVLFSAHRAPFHHFPLGPPPGAMAMAFSPPPHQQAYTASPRGTPPPAPSPTPPAPSQSPLPAAPPPSSQLPAPPLPLASSAQPAGKLDKLLEKLGAQFPKCTRAQLMSVLQQIKLSRGTMAGMSMDEVTQQVAQRLAQNETAAPGPIRPPSAARGFPGPPAPIQRPPGPIQRPPGPIQRPTPAQQRPAVAQVFHTRPPQPAAPSTRKLCLMCQNVVELDTQHPMSCSHTVHRECISVWLQSSKNNSCPFCPTK